MIVRTRTNASGSNKAVFMEIADSEDEITIQISGAGSERVQVKYSELLADLQSLKQANDAL